jgi:hypothetical protein
VVILPRTRYLYSKINLQSTIFQTDPWNLKMISKFALDTFQNYNLVPETSNSHIFSTVNPISVILAPKFSEPHPLSFHAFIIHVFFFILIVCVPHDWVISLRSNNCPWDFKTKSTRTSRVKYLEIHNSFSQSNKASVLEHIAPIHFLSIRYL